ncbi:hypothetical protein [Aquiflexum sp.]|uniref:hypothetical protein n=1 Tax=Aquiflexum sp. TaxID=1872584 RepID=UPI0035940BC0
MKKYLSLVLGFYLLLNPNNSIAMDPGDPPKNSITISAGLSILSRQDLVYSPFVHRDLSTTNYGFNFQRNGKTFQYFNLGFSHNSSQLVDFEEIPMDGHHHGFHPHEFLFIHSVYGIGKPYKKTEKNISYLGTAVRMDMQASFYSFALSNMFGYFINQSLAIWHRKTHFLHEKHTLSHQLELPMISWMARPPYLAEDDGFIENISSHKSSLILLEFVKDGKLVSWNQLQRANFQLEYRFSISRKISLGMDYKLDIIRTTFPRALNSYQQNLNLTTTLKF